MYKRMLLPESETDCDKIVFNKMTLINQLEQQDTDAKSILNVKMKQL